MAVAAMALFPPLSMTTIDGSGNDRIRGGPGNAADSGSGGMCGSAHGSSKGGGGGRGGGGATAICWAAAALAIAGWQATTKRVADGAINNQPLRK